MKKFIQEFKDFISKGNVVDLAFAVVIGNSFNAIVTSLVNDVIMPLVGIIIGGIDFTGIKITYKTSSIMVGNFIQNIINFLIIALSIFVMVKVFTKLSHKKKEEELPPPESKEAVLLEEIRDLLKKQVRQQKSKQVK